MEITTLIAVILQYIPASISLIFSIIVIAVAIYINIRKSTSDTKSSENNAYSTQIKLLLEQVTILSNDLNYARAQLSAIHAQNLNLMEQLRKANQKIIELESILTNSKCSTNEPHSALTYDTESIPVDYRSKNYS